MMIDKWDQRFLTLASHIAEWSRDPSTQTGAVIVDVNRRVVSVGYNGFPKRVTDTKERYTDRTIKYMYIVHADANAILFAQKDLSGCTMYTWPLPPCATCAGLIIQSGLWHVVSPRGVNELRARWEDSIAISKKMFDEAGVSYYEC